MRTTSDLYDVIIVGGGLAGLALARHLLMATDKRILVLEKRAEIPSPRQKVGESSVQVAGYYYGKVLDLEEYLFREHYMKYNLRFYWKSDARANDQFEDYAQAYIRTFSNIPCYQLDRNTFEAELLRQNCQDPRFSLVAPAANLDVSLSEEELHEVRFRASGEDYFVRAKWVVDTTGRGRLLARQLELREQNPVRHGASFLWVDGLVDIEKLTDRSPKEIRLKKDRRATGHLPVWLATNHFMGEGFWFWVIPLHDKTSLGLVYDQRCVARESVSTAADLLDWVCREFPLFERDLRARRVLDYSALKDFSHGCGQTISASRWAMSGEAGRFLDPLYSPGSDFISLHNTLIVDTILTDDARELKEKCRIYEPLMKALYDSLLPTFAVSYDCLGDQEAFVLKYTWELSVYFSFFVFPFINELSTDRRFVPGYLARFLRLGTINHRLQAFLSGFYQWKKAHGRAASAPLFHDFTSLQPLRTAEATFYQVGLSAGEALEVLDRQLDSLQELARYVVAHVYSIVVDDAGAVVNRAFVESIDFKSLTFDAGLMRAEYLQLADQGGPYPWTFDPFVLEQFRSAGSPPSGKLTANRISGNGVNSVLPSCANPNGMNSVLPLNANGMNSLLLEPAKEALANSGSSGPS